MQKKKKKKKNRIYSKREKFFRGLWDQILDETSYAVGGDLYLNSVHRLGVQKTHLTKFGKDMTDKFIREKKDIQKREF